ncbi:MAG: hypothetical protein HY652_03280 [Acidobacteria bacterium]|nr:hypothetical protein [Acidobacteriota bacterium]
MADARRLLGDNLKSVVLYGSAASGDFVEGHSDLNLLLVLEQVDLKRLRQGGRLFKSWVRRGNPAPLVFTTAEMQRSADVFPIEFLDMKESHQVLYGLDPLEGLDVDPKNLRLQCENELRGKLVRLRSLYLPISDRPRAVKKLLIDSSSSFHTLFRNVLRLLGEAPPIHRRQVVEKLVERLGVDREALVRVHDLREGKIKITSSELDELLDSYLGVISTVIDSVDRLSGK